MYRRNRDDGAGECQLLGVPYRQKKKCTGKEQYSVKDFRRFRKFECLGRECPMAWTHSTAVSCYWSLGQSDRHSRGSDGQHESRYRHICWRKQAKTCRCKQKQANFVGMSKFYFVKSGHEIIVPICEFCQFL